MKLFQRILVFSMIFTFVSFIAGCGQSGKLYLPKAKQPVVTKHAVNVK